MWTKIEVYSNHGWIGSFYTRATNEKDIIKDINEEFGNNWTHYHIGN